MLKNPPADPDELLYPNSVEEDYTEVVDMRNDILESQPSGIFIKYFD